MRLIGRSPVFAMECPFADFALPELKSRARRYLG